MVHFIMIMLIMRIVSSVSEIENDLILFSQLKTKLESSGPRIAKISVMLT